MMTSISVISIRQPDRALIYPTSKSAGRVYEPSLSTILAFIELSSLGIVPTLVVPVDRFLGSDIESRYKAMSDIIVS